jgi:hypothetical protein
MEVTRPLPPKCQLTFTEFRFVIQGVYIETPSFWRRSKNNQTFTSGVKGLLRIKGVQIAANILGYMTAHLWGALSLLT